MVVEKLGDKKVLTFYGLLRICLSSIFDTTMTQWTGDEVVDFKNWGALWAIYRSIIPVNCQMKPMHDVLNYMSKTTTLKEEKKVYNTSRT
jgi:hypothetical protein